MSLGHDRVYARWEGEGRSETGGAIRTRPGMGAVFEG